MNERVPPYVDNNYPFLTRKLRTGEANINPNNFEIVEWCYISWNLNEYCFDQYHSSQ